MIQPSAIDLPQSISCPAQPTDLRRLCPHNFVYSADYGCALQKEILVQGRLYISENHVCFNANIFGWVTNLVIAFSEITAIEKRLTAFVIPNAISIVTTTNTKGHFFASFLSRDSAYDLLMAAWRKSFPCAANAPTNGNNAYFRQNRSNLTLENGNGSGGGSGTGIEDNDDVDDAHSFISARGPSADSRRNRHRRTFSNNSQNWTADEAEYDDMDDPERLHSGNTLQRRGSKRAVVRKILKGSVPSTPSKRAGRGRSVSELPPPPSHFDTGRRDSTGSVQASLDNNTLLPNSSSPKLPQTRQRSGTEALMPSNTHPGHKNHPPKSAPAAQKPPARKVQPTTCTCSKEGKHYAGTYMNETFPGSVEAIWKLLFDSDFSKTFLTSEVMKGADVQEEGWKANSDGIQTKVTRYTKWLGMPIGPKTTKATLTDVCEHKDFDEYVTCVTTTSTPDVPSGSCFTTKNRTCITWAGPNQVRVVVTGAVEFTKTSWIKGQIEKGAADGMTTHYRELNQAMRKHIASHPAEFAEAGTQGTGNGATPAAAAAAASTAVNPSTVANGSASPGSPRPSGTAKKAAARTVATTQNIDAAKATNGSVFPKSSVSPVPGPSPLVQQLLSIKQTILQGLSEMVGSSSGSGSVSEGGLLNPLLLAVLVLVMAMNIYIWWQISSVTSQMQRIQNEILDYHWKTTRQEFNHHYPHPPTHHNSAGYNDAFTPSHLSEDPKGAPSTSSSSPSSPNDQQPNDSYDHANKNNNNRHDFWDEEEETMWAWLTEREALVQQAQKRRAADASSTRYSSSPQDASSPQPASSPSSFSDKDAPLQARILELQEQLEALEQRARMLERQEDTVAE
ncbi:hypothetical protein BGZ73_006727 [Actinomortierella ambigua]|nr:hypothetical protein BGZ73_006727 [Actinomortierella ambigua]